MRGGLSGRHHGRAWLWSGIGVAAGCGLLLTNGCAGKTTATGLSADRATVTASATPTTAPTSGPPPGSSTAQPPAFDGTAIDIVIADGEVVASEERVIVTLGTVIRLTVASDVRDELHVHGVDETVELPAGQTVTHDFTASVPGTFEVELHSSGDLLFTLQIQP